MIGKLTVTSTGGESGVRDATLDGPAWAETGWIQTYSGRKVYPLQPDPDQIDLADIAHALANMCRYTGHVREFFSVAQHSVLVSQNLSPELALWGLLHDAAEAYICDLPRPLKRALREMECGTSWYDRTEIRLMDVIARKFGLSWPQPPEVDRVDLLLLVTEARDLMSPLHPDWHFKEANGFAILPDPVVPVGPHEAEAMFLARYKEVGL